jgi:hypothetical protein
MWSSLVNIAQNAAAFLSSNRVPPGTPLALQDAMRKENHLTSKKFFITFTAFIGLLIFYFISIGVLFLLPQENREIVSGYVTIFTKTIEIVAVIIASYLGVQAVIDFKYGSTSNYSNEIVTSVEQIEENVIQQRTIEYAEKFKDDPSYAPIEWVFNQDNG